MNVYKKRLRAQTAAAIVGVDAGKFRHALVVRPRGEPDAKAFLFETTRAGFTAALERIRALAPGTAPADVLVGIEFAGSYGFTFAHFLHGHGYPVVNVLPADTKAWKGVTHGRALKTDAKDAMTIVDLLYNGSYVAFAFLEPAYAELRYLLSTRERLSMQRRAAITRIKSTLEVVFPEFERLFPNFSKRTPLILLKSYPGPAALLAAPRKQVLALLRKASKGKHTEATLDRLLAAAQESLALAGAQQASAREVPMLVAQIQLYEAHMAEVEALMVAQLAHCPEAEALLSVPGVQAVTAAAVLGAVGDPRAYESGRQILAVAGLDLTELSSGKKKGPLHISKRGRPGLRHQMYMLAVRSIREGGIARAEYQALYARNGGLGKKALVAVMRSLLTMLYSLARDRRTWTLAYRPPHLADRATHDDVQPSDSARDVRAPAAAAAAGVAEGPQGPMGPDAG